MAQEGAPAPDERFHVWIRRGDEPLAPFSLRFEVTDGKGVLRVARPGVLVDPPARPGGTEERLSASQVRASRFLHVWDGGRHRQGHLFARLEEAALDALPEDRWVPLVPVWEGSTALLLLPADLASDPGIVDDEPTWPRREMLAELQRELRGLERSGQGEPDTEVRGSPVGVGGLPGRTVATTAGHANAGPRTRHAGGQPGEREQRGPSLEELLSGASVEEDRTVLMAGPASIPPGGAPRPVLPKLPGLPDAPDPSDEYTQIEAFDAEDALDALEAATAVGFAPEEASEVLEAIEATGDHGGAIEALDAAEDEEAIEAASDLDEPEVIDAFGVDAPVVTDFRTQRVPEPRGLSRASLTDPITVMPEGAQDLAADNALRPASARASGSGATRSEGASAAAPPPPPARPSVRDGGAGAAIASVAPRGGAQENVRQAPEPESSENLHERRTTLVRHLRRRLTAAEVQMAADRERIVALTARVAELEAELARRR